MIQCTCKVEKDLNTKEKELIHMAKDTRLQELETVYDSRKSFYGKAHVKIDIDTIGHRHVVYYTLFSYDTFICEVKEIDGGKFINAFTDDESHLTQTTLRHLKEFMLQLNMEPRPKKEWLKEIGLAYTN